MDKVKNSENIVLSLKQQTLDRLKPCLSLIIEDTADYLFSLSTSTRLDPVNQNHCYDAFVMLQAETKQVVAQICTAVDHAFDVPICHLLVLVCGLYGADVEAGADLVESYFFYGLTTRDGAATEL